MKQKIFIALQAMLCSFIMLPLGHACLDAAWLDEYYDVTGIATTLKGEPLYRERLIHTKNASGGSLQVRYEMMDESKMYEKQLEYACDLTMPQYILQTTDGSYQESVSKQDGKLLVRINSKQKLLDKPSKTAIIDAGFDRYIRANWSALVNGDTLVAPYLFASGMRFVDLKIRRSKAPSNMTMDTANMVFFKIDANSFFLRLFATGIYMGYHQDNQTLRYFVGPSNLPGMDDYERILITYSTNAGESASVSINAVDG